MRLCGIDSSTTATSISLFENKEYKEYTLIQLDKKKLKTQWDRLNPMMIEIGKVLNTYKPDVIYQENTYKRQNIDTLKCLTNILGGVRYWSLINNCEYYTLTASQWRSSLKLNEYMASRENLKIKTIDFIKDKYGIVIPTDDVSDSIAVGLAGINYYYAE